MSKVLVLTTSTGQGHNQAANSLAEVFTKGGFEVIQYDFICNTSNFLNMIIVKGYEFSAAKIPHIFGAIYHLSDNRTTNKFLKLLFFRIEKKILSLITKTKPDIIISTHPLCINIIDRLKHSGLVTVPFLSVVTDFIAHSTYVAPNVDAYITGSFETKIHLCSQGVSEDKIYPYGIPVKSEFYKTNPDISSLKEKKDDYFNILLMGGSMGLSRIFYVLKELIANKHKLRIVVICGNNKSLKDKLDKTYSKSFQNKKIHIIGYTNEIANIMDYCDVVVSKPGGLTSTEAITKNIPLLIPFVIPGQETKNTEFLQSNGYAIYIKNIKDINNVIDSFIKEPLKLQYMKENLNKLSKNYSCEHILTLANRLIKEDCRN